MSLHDSQQTLEFSVDGVTLEGSSSEKIIDLSAGDPAHPFTKLAEEAFKKSLDDVHQYALSDPNNYLSKPIKEAVENMAAYFVERGFISEEQKESIPYRCIVTGGGTSESFEFILRMLVQDIVREKTKNKRHIRPMILIPVPTYGLFINQVRQWNLPIAFIKRDMADGGVLKYEDVKDTLDKLHRDGRRVVAFFDSNPHNPTGLIRGKEETEKLGQLLSRASDAYQKADEESGAPWVGPASRILIIDDMVYDGTEYQGETPAYSFLQVAACQKDTFVLLGVSKIGLAGLRAGLALGPEHLMKPLWDLQKDSTYFGSKPGLYALESYFSMQEPYQTWRREQLTRLEETHRPGGNLMKALIDGVESIKDIIPKEKTALIQSLVKHKNITEDAALKILNTPLAYVKVATSPKSGFFHMLDFTALKNSEFKKGNYTTILGDDEKQFLTIFMKEFNLIFLRGEWVGLTQSDMMFRVTYAMPEADIIESVDRLRKALQLFKIF